MGGGGGVEQPSDAETSASPNAPTPVRRKNLFIPRSLTSLRGDVEASDVYNILGNLTAQQGVIHIVRQPLFLFALVSALACMPACSREGSDEDSLEDASSRVAPTIRLPAVSSDSRPTATPSVTALPARVEKADPVAEESQPKEEVFCDPEHPVIPSPDMRIYGTWQSFRVPLGDGAGVGTLRILEDGRLMKSRPYLGTHPVLPPCDWLQSRLELLDASGKPIQSEILWPQVDIVVHEMGPGATLFETIERVQCIASCWCGDGHAFWRVEGGKLIRHRGRVVEKHPPGRLPAVGTIIPANPVTHGCYESSEFVRNAKGAQMLVIHRNALNRGSADERHWFEDGEWKISIADWK